MQNNLLTAGEFARLARTTKRTIHWYCQKEILKPKMLDGSNYRYFAPEQIIDFQVILLLRRLNFSVEEVKKYLQKNSSLQEIFKLKKRIITQEITYMQKALQDIDRYYHSLSKNGTLVSPKVKIVKSFEIYTIYKEGPYAKIKEYCNELKNMLSGVPKNAVFLSVFLVHGYRPKKAPIKVSVICTKNMKIKTGAETVVQRETVPGYKALSYIHKGPGSLLSLLWQQLSKYRQEHGYDLRNDLPFVDLEFYKKTSLNDFNDEENMEFEINLPIK